MIEIRKLEKRYDTDQVLEEVSLCIEEGDIYGLVGKSGAGKSTLLRCINGLEKYSAGSLLVKGQEVAQLTDKQLRLFRKSIGMIFQNFSLAERQTVFQNIALPMKWWKYDKKAIEKRVNELLRIVDLEGKRDAKPRELSGGQKQRVAIARALALEPEILLCDEATSALDPNTTGSILELLKKINRELHITIVIVTHEMSVVREVCNKIALLDKGKITVTGKVEDIFFQNPEALEVLVGGNVQDALPGTGKNIRILLSEEQMKNPTVADMALQTNIRFLIVHSDTERYRDKVLGKTILNIQEDDEDKLTAYLDKNHIEWQEV